MIKKSFKYLFYLLLSYAVLCLITPFNKTLRNRSIKNQINYLSEILDRGYDNKLQRKFPEGKLFSNCILALSTIEYCDNNLIIDEKYASIVDNCIKRIQSEKALSIFDAHLTPKYGMFYNGWTNYVYSKYKDSPLFDSSKLQNQIIEQSSIIEERLSATLNDSLRLLNTYVDASWPADNLIGLVSLSDQQLKQKWSNAILNSTDHPSGLIHHSGSAASTIRGSSSAMLTFCLSSSGYEDIEIYAAQHKKIFIDNFLGILLVKENEDGSNQMDVDSGPVVFGYGASATIMNIKTQANLGNSQSKYTWAAMNFIAFPVHLFKHKYYLLKKEPMLDLFMLWSCVELS